MISQYNDFLGAQNRLKRQCFKLENKKVLSPTSHIEQFLSFMPEERQGGPRAHRPVFGRSVSLIQTGGQIMPDTLLPTPQIIARRGISN